MDTSSGRSLGFAHDDMVFFAWRQLTDAFNTRLDPFRYLAINPRGQFFRVSDLQEFQEVCLGGLLQRQIFRRIMVAPTPTCSSQPRATKATEKPCQNPLVGHPA
jgi:hypothetical protein